MPEFNLQFDPRQITELAARYSYGKRDEHIQKIGANARKRGYYTREELLEVYRWKAPRSQAKLAPVTDSQAVGATKRALAATSEAERIEALTALPGVGVPVASALLHFAFPDEYPILDVRALESLGVKGRAVYPTSFWVAYVGFCRELARASGVSLRTLDKALWEYSKSFSRG